MESWLARAAATTGMPPCRRPRVEQQGDSNQQIPRQLLESLVVLTAKLSLKAAPEIREMQGAVFRTVIIKKESPWVLGSQTATSELHERIKAAKAQGQDTEGFGESHLVSWAAMCLATRHHPQCPEQGKALLADHVQTVVSPLVLRGRVLISKVKKPFNKGEMKWLVTAVPELEPDLNTIMITMVSAGGKVKWGQPPAGGLERELQQAVDQLQDWMSRA